jgi:hypothetical protein
MRPKTLTLTLGLILTTFLACTPKGDGADTRQATPTPAAQQSPAQPPQSATCRMLSAEDVREVQGEAPQDAQGSEHLAGGLSMSQCFYRLPTFNKSVNVEVVRAAEGSSSDEALKQFWRQRFRPDAVEASERERERKEEGEREHERELKRERESGQVREGGHKEKEKGGEEDESRPRRVAGLGEEAYWSGNQITAALSVLGKNAVVRISVGGPEGQDEKIKKASALARKLLKQL